MAKKILDELTCRSCGKKLSKTQPLFETAWSGLFWCGETSCAKNIMDDECTELDADDPCNHDD